MASAEPILLAFFGEYVSGSSLAAWTDVTARTTARRVFSYQTHLTRLPSHYLFLSSQTTAYDAIVALFL